MKSGYLHVCVILDASRSMAPLKDFVITSLTAFLNERRLELEKRCGDVAKMRLDVYLFSDDVKRIVHNSNLAIFDFTWLHASYPCEGSSAICDSIVDAIDSLGADFAALPPEERPEQALIAVVTDGRDNASRIRTLQDVKDRVALQSDVYNWRFEFFRAQLNQLLENCPNDETRNFNQLADVENVAKEENDADEDKATNDDVPEASAEPAEEREPVETFDAPFNPSVPVIPGESLVSCPVDAPLETDRAPNVDEEALEQEINALKPIDADVCDNERENVDDDEIETSPGVEKVVLPQESEVASSEDSIESSADRKRIDYAQYSFVSAFNAPIFKIDEPKSTENLETESAVVSEEISIVSKTSEEPLVEKELSVNEEVDKFNDLDGGGGENDDNAQLGYAKETSVKTTDGTKNSSEEILSGTNVEDRVDSEDEETSSNDAINTEEDDGVEKPAERIDAKDDNAVFVSKVDNFKNSNVVDASIEEDAEEQDFDDDNANNDSNVSNLRGVESDGTSVDGNEFVDEETPEESDDAKMEDSIDNEVAEYDRAGVDEDEYEDVEEESAEDLDEDANEDVVEPEIDEYDQEEVEEDDFDDKTVEGLEKLDEETNEDSVDSEVAEDDRSGVDEDENEDVEEESEDLDEDANEDVVEPEIDEYDQEEVEKDDFDDNTEEGLEKLDEETNEDSVDSEVAEIVREGVDKDDYEVVVNSETDEDDQEESKEEFEEVDGETDKDVIDSEIDDYDKEKGEEDYYDDVEEAEEIKEDMTVSDVEGYDEEEIDEEDYDESVEEESEEVDEDALESQIEEYDEEEVDEEDYNEGVEEESEEVDEGALESQVEEYDEEDVDEENYDEGVEEESDGVDEGALESQVEEYDEEDVDEEDYDESVEEESDGVDEGALESQVEEYDEEDVDEEDYDEGVEEESDGVDEDALESQIEEYDEEDVDEEDYDEGVEEESEEVDEDALESQIEEYDEEDVDEEDYDEGVEDALESQVEENDKEEVDLEIESKALVGNASEDAIKESETGEEGENQQVDDDVPYQFSDNALLVKEKSDEFDDLQGERTSSQSDDSESYRYIPNRFRVESNDDATSQTEQDAAEEPSNDDSSDGEYKFDENVVKPIPEILETPTKRADCDATSYGSNVDGVDRSEESTASNDAATSEAERAESDVEDEDDLPIIVRTSRAAFTIVSDPMFAPTRREQNVDITEVADNSEIGDENVKRSERERSTPFRNDQDSFENQSDVKYGEEEDVDPYRVSDRESTSLFSRIAKFFGRFFE